MLGVIDDVADRVPSAFRTPGDRLLLLGDTGEDLSGTAWAEVAHSHLGGFPPLPDFDHERRLARVLVAAAKRHLLTSAHDLADGGLAHALVESCLRHGLSAAVTLPEGDPTVQLFSESPGRVLVSLPPEQVDAFVTLCGEHGIPARELGEVTDTGELDARGLFSLSLEQVGAVWRSRIPEALRH
jgi:phosphoribosylformylglycinamidine synthase